MDYGISIIRNGKSIQLTDVESEQIFLKMRNRFAANDIKSYFEEFNQTCPFSDEKLKEMGEDIFATLSDNDDYIDAYNDIKIKVIEENLGAIGKSIEDF